MTDEVMLELKALVETHDFEDSGELHEILLHGSLLDEAPNPEDNWYRKYPEYLDDAQALWVLSEKLREFGFEHIEQEDGEDQGSHGHTVIKLKGKLYRLDYSYASYEGYNIDDIWNWKPVEARQKTITVYE